MSQRFELWSEYQTIQFQPRQFIGCSIFIEQKDTKEPEDEVYLQANIYDDSEHYITGINLAKKVLERFSFFQGDKIATIQEHRNTGIRTIDFAFMPVFYSVSRKPVRLPSQQELTNETILASGFIDWMSSNRKEELSVD